MAGGMNSTRGMRTPIARRTLVGEQVPPDATADGPAASVPPRREPFVRVGQDCGLVVEQRRGASGWEVLVALVVTEPDGARAVRVRWLPASAVRPAHPSADEDAPGRS
ncbi:MAG: hypothetical protein Q4G43_03195 [Mobilicoccus sp.]|nr:hypothetical protein [Mobilicoccus sp.]